MGERAHHRLVIGGIPQVKKSDMPVQFLDLILLSHLYARPMNGYALRNEIMKVHGFRVSFGTLYPHLRILEKNKFVVSSETTSAGSKQRKKTYFLTSDGEDMVKVNISILGNILARLQLILDSK